VLSRRVVIPNRECELATCGVAQIIVEKQTVDVFQTHNLLRIIEQLDPDRFVVYGVVTEICVLYAVRGLLKFGKPVTVVEDATQALAPTGALDEMRAGGALVSSTASEICR
jgi:nicotinamidase-related amidase